MADPLKDIEDRKANNDIGALAHQVYQGAIIDGATMLQAYLIACAFFVGMFHPKPPPEEEGGD